MNYQYVSRKILWGVVYAIFTLPLIPDWFIAGLYVKKEMLFQIFVELGVVALVASGLIEERGKSLFTRKSYVTWGLLALFGATALSTVFSIDPFRSFWGTFFRFGGLFTLTHLVVFFFILRFLMERHEQWHKIFSWILGINVFMMLIFFLQKMGMRDEWFLERTILGQADLSRPGSTLDNPAFLAAYLLAGAFLAIVKVFHAPTKRWRIVWGAIGVLHILVVLLTLTRASFVGLIGGMLMFLGFEVAHAFKSSEHKKKYILGGIALMVIIIGLLPFVLQRSLGRLSQLSISANQNRIMAWKIAGKAIQEYPILGWGPENFYVAFNKYFNPQFIGNTAIGDESWFDRAHNNILDVLVATGALGLLAYVAFVAALARALFRTESSLGFHGRVIMGALLVAYAVEHFFIFEVFSSFLTLIFVAALLEWSVQSEGKKALYKKPACIPGVVPRSLGAGLLMMACIYFYNIVPARAAGLRVEGDAYRAGNLHREALTLYENAFDVQNLFLQEEVMYVGNTITEERNTRLNELVVSNLWKIESEHSRDAQAPFIRGTLLLRLAEVYTGEERTASLGKARQALLRAHELSPPRQQIYYARAEERMASGDTARALELLKEALALNPDAAFSHWNLGLGYLRIRDLENARVSLEEAVRLDSSLLPRKEELSRFLK